jgi:hypothetical protein
MDVLALLDERKIEYIHAGDNEVAIVCPNQVNHQDGSDDKPSFRINIVKLVGHCFACNYKMGEITFRRWAGGEDLDELELQGHSIRAKLRRIKENYGSDESTESVALEVFTPIGTPWNIDGYRGISIETYETLDALYVTQGRYQNRICFPIYINGMLKGVDARALGDEQPKYLRNSKCSCKTDWLYPYDLVKSQKPYTILLGEGIFHSINAIDKGFSGLCYFGANNWSETKLLMMMATGASEIIYFKDNDKAGRKAEQFICSTLDPFFDVYTACTDQVPEGKDLGDLYSEQINYAIANKTKPKLPQCRVNHPFLHNMKATAGLRCYERKCPFNKKCTCTNTEE